MGRHLSPRYGQMILVSGYPVLTAVNWLQHWCAICLQYQSSFAFKLARKCEIEHWLPCGADGVLPKRDYQIFWDGSIYLPMVLRRRASLARAALLYGLPTIHINKLQRVQNAAARLVTNTPRICHITPILKDPNWLPIKYRIEFKIVLLTFKCLYGLAPQYLVDLIAVCCQVKI